MITSGKNQQIKNLMALIKKNKERNNQKVYIVEGEKMVGEIPPSDLVKVYFSESYFNKTMNKHLDYEYDIIKDSVFDQIADTNTPQGILAIVRQREYCLKDLLANREPSVMVLEDLQDPGNVGTIIRTAEGAGFTGVILSKQCVDLYNPKVVRATMGSLLRMPLFIADHLEDTIKELKDYGVKIYAAHLQGSCYHYEVDYSQSGVAFLIGNESKGLTNAITNLSDGLIKIPLHGNVESLNASIAASLLMYEVERQKRNK
ncbi:TrmH family RNA methyltransferase [Natranaerovirga pectinivora]|uniref:TrmH family RNA methyltransferase n=1 Tax=Natranaerovirga pectinivora TaxID=682400 RepID=A0A4R3MKD6_9FIRM|nr:RNA methyltransferase [Natranaerovirga pectinivora]TCT14691.1 TrmH family RNA methyltransferase [Natranaerovirga pectinivora]